MRESHWLARATRRIDFTPDQRAVRGELFDHIEEAKAALMARHPEMTALEAEERAVAAMGDPEALAWELARIHRPWSGYLWRLSQVLAGLALAALAGVWIWQLTNRYAQEGPLPYLRQLSGWESFVAECLPEAEERLGEPVFLPQSARVRVGGYEISAPEAVLVTVKPGEGAILDIQVPQDGGPCRGLYVELELDRWLTGEYVYLAYAVSRVADSTGKVYELGREGRDRWIYRTSHPWGDLTPFGERGLVALCGVPEEAEWVDITFGRGEDAGTLRVELSEVTP